MKLARWLFCALAILAASLPAAASNFSVREAGVSISVATTTGTTAIDTSTAIGKRVTTDIAIYNPGPNTVHVRAGGAGVTADTTGMPVPSGAMATFSKGDATHLAHIAVGGSQNILVFTGQGSASIGGGGGGGGAVTQSGVWASRTQDGSGNPITSSARGAERAMTVQIVDGAGAQVTSFGGSGGTASNFGSAVPAQGTAAGVSDGTNMVAARSYDTDSGAGTQNTLGVTLRKAASGGSVEAGTSSDPIRTDPTGTTTQPVSAASLPLPTGASTSANQSTANTSLSNIDTDLGAAADAVCGSDTGTCSLIALAKRQNQNITSDPNYTQATGSAVPTRAVYMAGRTGANAAAVPIAGTTAAITMSTATTTQFVALSGTTLTYVSSLSILAGGTTNATLVYGTGANCATGQVALTGAYPLTAQVGLVLSGLPAIVVPSGQALCVTSSAAVQVSGHVTYTQF